MKSFSNLRENVSAKIGVINIFDVESYREWWRGARRW
jgi:hypothetical protein